MKKIKWNWGTGIFIAFVAFVSFIMFFIYRMSTDKKFNYELVSKDYYQQELKFQDQIQETKNANEFKDPVRVEKSKEGLKIYFSDNFDHKKIKGKVFLYRPSNKQLDFEMPIAFLDSSYLLMPDKRLLGGRWNISVSWSYEGKKYFYKKEIFY